MTWAYVHLENVLITFLYSLLFASWCTLHLPRRESGVCSGINHFNEMSERVSELYRRAEPQKRV